MKKLFEAYIDTAIASMQGEYIELVSGDIHCDLGGYPTRSHHMPICCAVMYSRMENNDVVLAKPLKGKGATLKIRYYKR